MGAIVNFIEGIGAGILSIVDFVGGFIEDVLYLVQITAEFVAQIPDYLSFLPAELLALITTIFAVVVIYKILGRE